MPPSPSERLKTALADRYDVGPQIGEGGMATVYRAHDLRHDRPVALKLLKPGLAAALGAERFLREITLTARLDHPHVVPLLDSGEADGLLYYVMPYVEGESLRERLDREKQLSLDDAIQITREVADALSYAQSHGVVHRDIKPENILLAGGHARVVDFGIARAVTTASAQTLTETGLAVGTPAYMSPEQAAGERAPDARSDVYSLACVVYEMLAGEPPYTGATAEAILARKLVEAVPSLRVVREAVPVAVEQAITTALAAVPADRFATASRFAEALERESSRIAPMPTPAAPWSRRYVLFGAAASLVTVLFVGAYWMLGRPSATSPIRSLAVLPLNNLVGDSAQDYFVDGMHEALTAELSKVGALKVISRTSAMRYRRTDKGTPQIARELGVQGLIEGSVLRDGNQVRITVQLIDGASDQRIWGDSYQRELSDILSLQQEVARAIAAQIQVRLTDAEQTRLASAPTVDPAAYEDYLRGLHEWGKFTGSGWGAAIGYFQKSIEQAPSFAPAYAMMSFAYSWLGYYTDTSPAVLRSGGLNAAERAVALDPSLPEAHASLALVKTTYDWDWLGADRASQEALRLNPNSALALLSRGFLLSFTGRHDEAISVGRRAVELDPVAPYPNTWLGWIHFMARRYDDAIAQVNAALALEPHYRDAHVVLVWAYAKKGMYDQALATRRRLAELWPEEASQVGPPGWWADAWILALAGRADEARAILDQVPGHMEARPKEAFWLALSYGELGERDRALALLDVAYQGRDALMSVLNVDPRFDALRDDPRFDDLLRRMNFRD